MEDQIILIDKPAGITSFGVVAKIRNKLKQELGHKVKVGHTGTLDPFATGLLILLSGKYTKKSSEFLKLDKTYKTTIKLGYTSTTGDPEGEITEKSQKVPSIEEVKSTIQNFIGEMEQTPPRFSAIKIGGQRAYKLARKNQNFNLPPRKVTIYNIEILDYSYPILRIKAHVSSGTYIRTLAEDIGKKLATGAYCLELRRTQIGSYDIFSATTLEKFK